MRNETKSNVNDVHKVYHRGVVTDTEDHGARYMLMYVVRVDVWLETCVACREARYKDRYGQRREQMAEERKGEADSSDTQEVIQ